MKQKPRSQPKPTLFIVLLIVLCFGVFLSYVLNSKVTDTKKGTTSNNSQWLTYENSSYSIAYPPEWTMRTSPQEDITEPPVDELYLLSPDYEENPAGYPVKGFKLRIIAVVDYGVSENGLISEEETTWLGQPATLRYNRYEGNFYTLSAVLNGVKYSMIADVTTEEDFQNNKEIIMKIANSMQFK